MAKVGILGAGSWGTALAILLHDNGHDVIVWSIDPKEVEMLSEKREHVSKLPGVHISEEIMITNEMEEAIKGKDFLVLAVPSIFTRMRRQSWSPLLLPDIWLRLHRRSINFITITRFSAVNLR